MVVAVVTVVAGLCLVQLALLPQRHGQVVHRVKGLRVLCAQRFFPRTQGASIEGLGLGNFALGDAGDAGDAVDGWKRVQRVQRVQRV